MKRLQSSYVLNPPARRPLRIFASDPMARTSGSRITIDIPNESPLPHGPQGSRIEVIDYDGGHGRFYPPINPNDEAVLMEGGLQPTESDPRFHQQMVYGVAMKTLENFDRALGRRLEFKRPNKYSRLRLFPHAFHGANAFYSHDLNAVLFGYFKASTLDPGSNLPGQTVFTCLSHDVIAHEMSHALVDRLRRYFLEPSNGDVLAFHEAFADIVALFQHFSFEQIVREEIQKTRTDLRQPGLLVDLAQQFGHATGLNRALRSAVGNKELRLTEEVTEPHKRGSILVAAVFDGFFDTYQRRIRDLIRIATGGTGNLPAGDLHPDLISRIASESAQTAQSILTMCIRAFDYLPPVDIRYGDYLRALVTADYELAPADQFGQRQAIVEAFRQRGIFPDHVASLAEESLLWEPPEKPLRLPFDTVEMLRELAFAATSFGSPADPLEESLVMQTFSLSDEGTQLDISADMALQLAAFADDNKADLFLDPSSKIEVHGFHPVFRVGPDGQLSVELVAMFAQHTEVAGLGGIPFRGGTTLVASADGRVRYLITKPLPSTLLPPEQASQAKERLDRQLEYISLCDAADPQVAFSNEAYLQNRMRLRMDIAAMHMGLT